MKAASEIAGDSRSRARGAPMRARAKLAAALAPARRLEAAAALVGALGDPDSDLRWGAAAALVRLGAANPEPIARMLARAANGASACARRMALYCLRDLGWGDGRARRAAIRALDDRDAHVRLAALAAIGRIEACAADAAAVIDCLNRDPIAGVRRAAAVALGRLGRAGAAQARAALKRAARSRDESMARAARHGLRLLEGG